MWNSGKNGRIDKSKGGHKDNLKEISIALVKILRHDAVKLGLIMDSAGFISLDDILSMRKFNKISIDDIKKIVETNNKKRFELIETFSKSGAIKYYIRAVQGHSGLVGESIKDDEATNEITLDNISDLLGDDYKCVHGTNLTAWDIIKTEGLNKMTRKHIHCAISDDLSKIESGFRPSSKVIIYIDIKRGLENGLKFYLSKNKVILCPDIILPEYFSDVKFN